MLAAVSRLGRPQGRRGSPGAFGGAAGVIKPGTEINDIVSHEDWVPTLVAAAGEPNVKDKLLTGYKAAGKTFKVHLDGYDQRDLLAGTGPGKRKDRRRPSWAST